MLVGDVLPKGRTAEIVKLLDGASALDVAREMMAHGVGSVVIRTRAGNILGIVGESEIVAAAALQSDLSRLLATSIMLSPVPCIDVQESVLDALGRITACRFRHLLVTEQNVACAVVSIGDLVKAQLDEILLENSVLRDMTYLQRILRG